MTPTEEAEEACKLAKRVYEFVKTESRRVMSREKDAVHMASVALGVSLCHLYSTKEKCIGAMDFMWDLHEMLKKD